MERSGCPTKRGNWGRGGGSPCKPKSLNFLLLLDKNITYWKIPDIGKKVSLIAFRQVLTKILPATFIRWHNYDLSGKAQLKLSPLIQNNVQQDYIPDSCARFLLSHQKCQTFVAPTRPAQVRLSPLLLNLYGKPWGCEKILPNSQKCTHFPIRKIPLNIFKNFPIKV